MEGAAPRKQEIRRKHYLARRSSSFHYEFKGFSVEVENRGALKIALMHPDWQQSKSIFNKANSIRRFTPVSHCPSGSIRVARYLPQVTRGSPAISRQCNVADPAISTDEIISNSSPKHDSINMVDGKN
ncbi:TPA: hypothetical protein ACYLN4_005430 [Burkholderia lata]